MSSSPTPSCPIRSRNRDVQRLLPLVALCVVLCAQEARAHGEAGDPLPPEPGLIWEAAAVVRALDADKTLPSNRLEGFLLQGDAGMDPDGIQLEHGALGLAARISDTWGARLVIGKHGGEPVEVEEAWAQARHDADNGDVWRLNVGRQRPAMGVVLAGAGHFDRFGLMPLAQRMALDHDWVDDGLQLSWRRENASVWSADVGLWRGRNFPGAVEGSTVPSVHLGWGQGPWQADALWAGFKPQGRGATVSATAGHSHGTLVCDASLTEVICFGGESTLAAASLRWSGSVADSPLPLTFTAAGWLREDSGTLASANGLANYNGRNRGGWLEAVWRVNAALELGWRTERLSAAHKLHGAGAALLATEARLNRYAPARRNAVTVGYRLADWAQLRAEAGRESVAGQSAGYAALRLVLQAGGAFAQGD